MKGNNSFSWIELLIVIAVVGIVGTISVPSWLRARVAGSEASIVALLHAINSAQSRYAASCENDPSLKTSYSIMLTAGLAAPGVPAPCNGMVPGTVVTTYFVTAVPTNDGDHVFGTNQSGRIYQSSGPMKVTYSGVPFGASEIQ